MAPRLLDRELRAAFRIPPGSGERLARRALEGVEVPGSRIRHWPEAVAVTLTLMLALGAARIVMDGHRESEALSNAETNTTTRFVIISGSRPDRSGILIVEHGGAP